jgi:glucose-6-phosphate isomerase
MAPQPATRPKRILVLDIGGTHVKAGFSDAPREIKIPSGPDLVPQRMLKKLARRLKGQRYDAVSIGYPGFVVHGRIVGEPHHLARGWVGFDFERAFHRPTRIVNDAALQALGSYHGGSMLFLGLGTGLGTAMVVDGRLEPMELAHLPYKKGKTYEDFVNELALERVGRKKWEKEVFAVTKILSDALEPDYVVLGGGNVRKLKNLPPRAERGDNRNALAGGVRLWADSREVNPSARTAPLPPKSRRR